MSKTSSSSYSSLRAAGVKSPGQLQLFKDLCAKAKKTQGPCLFELCEVSLVDGKLPDWICLLPAGAKILAADGREFANTEPDKIVAAFDASPVDLPIDWEHASELKAPEGDQAPAAGWITEMEVRDGAVWGKVSWTSKGEESLTSKSYRYLSPAFIRNKVGNVLRIVSAALTNQPALDMLPALAREEANQADGNADRAEDTMDPKLIESLGLKADATMEQVLAAIASMREALTTAETKTKAAEDAVATARASVPSLDKFVPRADFDKALCRAQEAEKKIADEAAAARQQEINTIVETAMKDGKVVPASKDFYLATCAMEGGLEKFKDFIKTAPVIGEPSKLEGTKPPDAEQMATDAALEVAMKCGVSKDQYLKAAKV